jgi:tryptophan synthase alpha chain
MSLPLPDGRGSARISRYFARLRGEGKKGLIAYLTAGDPSPEETVEMVRALERGGAGLIELGVPFSDPVADGPVIQAASERSLKAGTTLRKVLELAAEIRRESEVPLLLFSYLNPMLRYGLVSLARDAAAAGVDGCLATDLSVEEAHDYVEVMRAHNLDTVFLAAPTSTPRRLELVAKYSTGFVYLVSRTGVTGERESLSAALGPLVASMRNVTGLPLAVGFGISTPEQVRQVGELADAVVVGSAFVRLIGRNIGVASLPLQLETLARELKHGFEMKGT